MLVKYRKLWKGWLTRLNFGSKLKELRKNHKLTQQQLAERVGVSKSVISYYESGDRYPSYDILVKIARIFHTSTDFLLDISRENIIDVTGLSRDEISAVRNIVEVFKTKSD